MPAVLGEDLVEGRGGEYIFCYLVVFNKASPYYGKVVRAFQVSDDEKFITVSTIDSDEEITMPAEYLVQPIGRHWTKIHLTVM